MKHVVNPHGIQSKQVLVVDDESAVANTIRMVLVHGGHKVEIVEDAESALAKFEPGKYDLVISDLSLGKMNGLSLADAIRELAPQQPFILITAYADSIQADATKLAKVNALLGKPFSLDQLQGALLKVFPTG